MNVFYINLDSQVQRNQKFEGKGYTRCKAIERSEVSPEVDKRMKSMWNYPRQSHLGRCGCFLSHLQLYKWIVKGKVNDVLVLEDDAVEVEDINEVGIHYAIDGITYVGGFFHHTKMMDNSAVIHDSKVGLNKVGDFRILMTMSYIIPNWGVAQQLIDYIEGESRWKAIDIMLSDAPIQKHYQYPALFEEEGSESSIHTKTKKANQYYMWVKKGKVK
jgi:GR25 family glycosyltransferase involved in LPS biosynthesis